MNASKCGCIFSSRFSSVVVVSLVATFVYTIPVRLSTWLGPGLIIFLHAHNQCEYVIYAINYILISPVYCRRDEKSCDEKVSVLVRFRLSINRSLKKAPVAPQYVLAAASLATRSFATRSFATRSLATSTTRSLATSFATRSLATRSLATSHFWLIDYNINKERKIYAIVN